MAETYHDDMREVRAALSELVAGQARTEQKIDGLDKRLYNGGSGAIPTLFNAVEEQRKGGAETKAVLTAAITAVDTRVSNQRAYAIGYAGGVTLVLAAIKYGLGKLGLNF